MIQLGASLCRAVLVVAAVAQTAACVAPGQVSQPQSCTGEQRYIPAATFPKDYPGSDEHRRLWYSTALARLDEPSLACDETEIYRMMWLNEFAAPVVIRVSRYGLQMDLEAFQLSGTGMADPGYLAYRVHRELTAEEWSGFQSALSEAHFWSLPTSGNLYGAHGEQWVVEGRKNGTYHIVDRWSPLAGPYRDLGTMFFDLAGWLRPFSTNR